MHQIPPNTEPGRKRTPSTRAARSSVGLVEPDEHRAPFLDLAAESEQDAASTEPLPSLSCQLLRQALPPGIHTRKVTALADMVEQDLAALVSASQDARQTLYTAAASTLASYIEQGAELASIEVLASLTRQTRARLVSTLKKQRSACVRRVMSLVSSLDRQYKLGLTPIAKESTKQALERQLDALADYLINRLVEDDIESQDAASTEPINLQIRRKAAALREYGYVLSKDGLYSVRVRDDEEILTLIGKLFVDVTEKRHIYTVPECITDKPKESGVVLVTEFAPLTNRKESQTLELHRSDMLSRQPKFIEQIQKGKPPHKQRLGDFIDAIEAMGMAAPVKNRYNATGLIRPDETFILLHPSGGALVPGGMDEKHRVQFPLTIASRLTSLKYGWQRASSPSEQRADYQTLLKMLNIAPGSAGYGDVLLGIHGFAPMSQLCDTGGLWAIIHGITGSFKSATSRLPLQGYAHGYYGRNETSTVNLAEGKSTPYATEQVLYYLAGMFAHLDDALKGNNVPPKDVEKFYRFISEIGRHAVTKQGGKRGIWGSGEGGFGIEPYARGSGVLTTETLPDSEGHASELARFIVVSLDGANCVDVALLTQLQEQDAAASMNRATCSYIQWLLPHMEEKLAGITELEELYREKGVHSRTPTSYGKAETGIAALLEYGVSIGAHSQQDAARLIAESRARLVHVALKQKALMGIDEQTAQANDTVHVFYEKLHDLLDAHKLYVSDSLYQIIDEKEWNESESKYIITGQIARPQPPRFLINEEEDVRPWGWRWDDKLTKYILAPEALEAGVLKQDGAKRQLWMYAETFKSKIYPRIDELATSKNIPLPGLNEMLSKLKEKGKLTSIESTTLHGRASKKAGVYILDMSPAPENLDELATRNEDGTFNYDQLVNDGE
jgi:hypothetical protein